MIGRFIISRNESCHESRPGDDPSHHQRSPPPVFLDSVALTPHTCHSSHSQLFPIKMDYLYTTLLLLALVELYVHVCILSRCFSYAGDTCTVCRFLCPSCLPVLFFALLAFLLFIKALLPAVGPRPLFTWWYLSPPRDKSNHCGVIS